MDRVEHVPAEARSRRQPGKEKADRDPLRKSIAKASSRLRGRWKAELREEMDAMAEFLELHN